MIRLSISKLLLYLCLVSVSLGQAQFMKKPDNNVVLSNGADYEMRFSFSIGTTKDFIVPRDAVLEIYLDTYANYTLTIYRGDTNALVWTGTAGQNIIDRQKRYYGVRQTATNAFTVHETQTTWIDAPLSYVEFPAIPDVYVVNSDYDQPIDVNITGGSVSVDSAGMVEPLQHIWAIALAAFVLGCLWIGYRIYYR